MKKKNPSVDRLEKKIRSSWSMRVRMQSELRRLSNRRLRGNPGYRELATKLTQSWSKNESK